MIDANANFSDVADFRMMEFENQNEFEHYLNDSAELRASRWLYEQSLASSKAAVVLDGTCGICLSEACFTSPTAGGEATSAGLVPNWREGLVCDCERRLINRERSLLHYMLTKRLLQPWTRVLGLGDLRQLKDVVGGLVGQLVHLPGPLTSLLDDWPLSGQPAGYHLLISVEQFDAASCRPEIMSRLAMLLVDGGSLVFTAPFIPTAQAGTKDTGPFGWSILDRLRDAGFTRVRASTHWSEEFGYLGQMNFIFSASR
jgi:hypothetical protein